MDALNEVKQYSCWQLAELAECAAPDRLDSAGAQFLYYVRDQAVEAWTSGRSDNGSVHEIADSAPDVYDHIRWCEFTDLGAWAEDLNEVPDLGKTTLTEVAGLALCQVASRLAAVLLTHLATP